MNEEETVGDGAAIAMTSPELDDTIIIVTDKQTNREYFGELLSLSRTAQPSVYVTCHSGPSAPQRSRPTSRPSATHPARRRAPRHRDS